MGVGLAIGVDAVRACEAVPGWQGLHLLWCGVAALPVGLVRASPREANLASVGGFRRHLAEVFRGLPFRRRLQVGLPDPSARVQVLFADDLPNDPATCRRYLLWRLADVLDCPPDGARLAHMAVPSPLPGPRHAVLCAVAGETVVRQYERALAESRVRYAGIAPSSVLLFNLFHRQLAGPPGAPVLLLTATEDAVTTILTLAGRPIFWRSRARHASSQAGPAPSTSARDELLRDVVDTIAYAEDRLGVPAPARILLAGPAAQGPGLPEWLAAQVGLPTHALDAAQLLNPVPHRIAAEETGRWAPALAAAARQ